MLAPNTTNSNLYLILFCIGTVGRGAGNKLEGHACYLSPLIYDSESELVVKCWYTHDDVLNTAVVTPVVSRRIIMNVT